MVVADDIKSDLLALFVEMDTAPMSREAYAAKWSALLAKHIKTAEIPAGTFVVQVEGDATGTSNAGPVNVQ